MPDSIANNVRSMGLGRMAESYRGQFESDLGRAKAKALVSHALYEAGKMWIAVFLPKRFDKGYASRYLNYKSTKSYDKWKERSVGRQVSFTEDYVGFTARKGGASVTVEGPQATPFVFSGKSKASALTSAYPVPVVKPGNAVLKIKLNIGAIKFRNNDVFTKVPPHEYQAVIEYAERILRTQLQPMVDAQTTPDSLLKFKRPTSAADFHARISADTAAIERTA